MIETYIKKGIIIDILKIFKSFKLHSNVSILLPRKYKVYWTDQPNGKNIQNMTILRIIQTYLENICMMCGFSYVPVFKVKTV